MKKNYTLNDQVNREILKDSLMIGGSSILVGAGVYGVVTFDSNLIDYCNAGNFLNLKTVSLFRLHEVKFFSSFLPIAFGGNGIYKGAVKLKRDLRKKNK